MLMLCEHDAWMFGLHHGIMLLRGKQLLNSRETITICLSVNQKKGAGVVVAVCSEDEGGCRTLVGAAVCPLKSPAKSVGLIEPLDAHPQRQQKKNYLLEAMTFLREKYQYKKKR